MLFNGKGKDCERIQIVRDFNRNPCVLVQRSEVWIDCFGTLSLRSVGRQLGSLVVAVQMHSTTWVSTQWKQSCWMCFPLPLEVIKSGKVQNGLDPVYTCPLVIGLMKTHRDTKFKHGWCWHNLHKTSLKYPVYMLIIIFMILLTWLLF